ncbi:MAG: cation:proton antiporter, partial [Patescibacteria group bacterium]|nr:cation:proton antiporter [Patescibacteria group bacterium]
MPANFTLLWGLLAVLGSAFLGGFWAGKIKQPLMFGYLLSGLLFSYLLENFGLKRETLGILAEMGLALLMFSLGLEFSFQRLEKLKKIALGGGSLQIILTIGISALLFKNVFGFDFPVSLVMGSAFSLSSTAIVVKILQEKGQLESLSGEILESWLLFQDLAVLPLMSLLPLVLGQGSANYFSLLAAFLALGLAFGVGIKLIPYCLNYLMTFKNRELLLVFSVCIVFLFGLGTLNFGFSFALGAFLAGLILSQSQANHAIFSEIRPLRDVFLAIFFVSLGLSLEPGFLFSHVGQIIGVTAIVILLKTLVVGSILVFFHYHLKTIFTVALGLSEVGEFAFALAAAAFSGRFLNQSYYSLIISVTLLTMVLTPLLFSLAEKLYFLSQKILKKVPSWQRRFLAQYDQLSPPDELPFLNHVVILGYGRVGKWVGSALGKAKIPYLVVEYNPQIVRQLE